MGVFLFFIFILFSMGFYLLLERKLLGLMNLRLGPNKSGVVGWFQFLYDSVKLCLKDLILNFGFYFLVLMVFLFVSLVFWLFFSLSVIWVVLKWGLLMFILLLMLKLLLFIIYVFFSDSLYGFLGLIRCIVQLICYDLLLILCLIYFVVFLNFSGFLFFSLYQFYVGFFMASYFFFIFWFVGGFMELSRLPFDFFEGESELVSGFNIEFGSFYFMVIFMVEYLDILFFCYISSCMFFGVWGFGGCLSMMVFILIIRGFLVRVRYDYLVYLGWFKILGMLVLVISVLGLIILFCNFLSYILKILIFMYLSFLLNKKFYYSYLFVLEVIYFFVFYYFSLVFGLSYFFMIFLFILVVFDLVYIVLITLQISEVTGIDLIYFKI